MRAEGVVKSVSGNFCEVVVMRETACGENCASCGAGCKKKNAVCAAKNDIGAKIGDKVAIEIDSFVVLSSAFLVYIVPLVIFIAVFFFAPRLFARNSCNISNGSRIGIFWDFAYV